MIIFDRAQVAAIGQTVGGQIDWLISKTGWGLTTHQTRSWWKKQGGMPSTLIEGGGDSRRASQTIIIINFPGAFILVDAALFNLFQIDFKLFPI
jgi:hypothetical protein